MLELRTCKQQTEQLDEKLLEVIVSACAFVFLFEKVQRSMVLLNFRGLFDCVCSFGGVEFMH